MCRLLVNTYKIPGATNLYRYDIECPPNEWSVEFKNKEYDVEIISEYAMFTSEILNDKKTSDEYKSQLMDLGNETKSTIDESNLCHLDLNTVVSSDEYQCVIYSAMAENLGTITHISLSLCGMLGYSKDEILGKSIELILPESFEKAHRKYLRKISVISCSRVFSF